MYLVSYRMSVRFTAIYTMQFNNFNKVFVLSKKCIYRCRAGRDDMAVDE